MITIVNYGMGNLGSVQNMFIKIGVECEITSNSQKIKDANKILLPGVGSFDAAIERINERGFKEILDIKANEEKIPILGICLGMQLMLDGSEEGEKGGFSWIPGYAKRFHFHTKENLKIPHMGWNTVEVSNPCALTKNFFEEPRFYFVHSYYVSVKNEKHSMLKTNYGGNNFDSGIHKENIFGAQFHPEKSHKFGMKLFENFAKL